MERILQILNLFFRNVYDFADGRGVDDGMRRGFHDLQSVKRLKETCACHDGAVVLNQRRRRGLAETGGGFILLCVKMASTRIWVISFRTISNGISIPLLRS